MTAELEDRLRRFPATGAMAVCFSSLLLGAPFAVAWLLDDGGGNQPFPRGLRRLVLVAAALHFGAIAYRLVKAAWTRQPVLPIVGKLAKGYVMLAVAASIAWELRNCGVLVPAAVACVPSFWGFYLLAQALRPETPEGERDQAN
jgi:hypothetical protein